MESLKELRARALELGVDESTVRHRGRKDAWLEAIRSAELSLVREVEVQTESETLIKVGAVSPGYQDELLSLKDAAGKKLDSRPTLLTFFCGGGLFTEGAKLAGFQPVGAIDSDPEVVKIYNSNNVVPAVNAPIRSRYCPEYPDVTLIQASPPCTNFSLADNTKRDKESFADLSLSISIIKAALASNPKALLIENVPLYKASDSYKCLKSGMKNLGYKGVSEFLLNSAYYGVPQSRIRFYAVFFKPSYLTFDAVPFDPQPVKCWWEATKGTLSDQDEDTLADFQVEALNYYYKTKKFAGRILLVERVGANTLNPLIREVGRPSPTVRACKNSRSPYAPNVVIDYGSPNQKVYKLNSRSLVRLQGVPDTYKLSGERVDYTVIGNGVSVPIAQTLCEFIKETLELDKALNDAWILCNGDKDLFLDVSSDFLPICSDLGVNFLEDK